MNRRAPAVAPSRRGILGGAVLLAVGAAFFLPPLGVPNAGAYLFVALGIAFAAAWWRGPRPYVYPVPACVLIGFGLGLVIPALFDLPTDSAGPVFLGTLAAGLVAVSTGSTTPGATHRRRPSHGGCARILSCRSHSSRSRCSRISCR